MTKHSQLSEFSNPPRFLLPESHPDHSEVEEELGRQKVVIFVLVGITYDTVLLSSDSKSSI